MKTLIRNLQAAAIAGAMPPALWAAKSPYTFDDGKLPYRPLDGRSLRELAGRKEHHGNGRFVNPVGLPREGRFWELLTWKLSANAYADALDRQPRVDVGANIGAITTHDGVSVTFVKHASVLVKVGDRTFLVDPVFDEIFWFIKDFSPLAFDPHTIPGPDHVLITHGHYDHLDEASLATFPADTHVISPLGHDRVFSGLGMSNRTRIDWYETYADADITITFLPANHWTMRNPIRGPNRSLWGGYLIETAGGPTIYLSGDTAYFDGFSELGRDYAIDLAIFNLGAYAPRWFMASSHMNPSETVRAFKEIGAKRLMIVHWGTFRLGDEPVHFPPKDLKRELEKEGLADRLVDLQHGQTVFLT
ncbi:MAG: MBL fold metallo-hydrolase [Desulfobacterales bacterium]|nr:MBL fold metallo-hydrolase [Desulfobacterales bacterium]